MGHCGSIGTDAGTGGLLAPDGGATTVSEGGAVDDTFGSGRHTGCACRASRNETPAAPGLFVVALAALGTGVRRKRGNRKPRKIRKG
jgi:MYXO-CTERM domain-containing protein